MQPLPVGRTPLPQRCAASQPPSRIFFSKLSPNFTVYCSIFEDKNLQKTKNFTQEKNLPLTIGILLDTSGSQQNVLPLEQQSGAEFLKDVLTPKDEAFLISFDINVNLLADYTNSPREIRRAIDSAQINTGAGTGSVTGNGAARGTLLFDAVYLAAH